MVWNTPRGRAAIIASVVLVGLPACGLFHRARSAEQPAAQDREQPRSQSRERLTDGNISAIFLAANNTDISYAKVALVSGHATAPAVVAFATRMLNDHSGLNENATQMLSKTSIIAEDNIMSLNFRDESAAKRDTLRELSGAQFDSTYMANEVRYHTKLLSVLDSLLLPSARNADLKSLLTGVRPAVAAHLEHAERVQAGLRK